MLRSAISISVESQVGAVINGPKRPYISAFPCRTSKHSRGTNELGEVDVCSPPEADEFRIAVGTQEHICTSLLPTAQLCRELDASDVRVCLAVQGQDVGFYNEPVLVEG